MKRRLAPDEQALWAKVIASVRPLDGRKAVAAIPPDPVLPAPPEAKAPVRRAATAPPSKVRPDKARPGMTLDSTWDRRLAQGAVAPDMTVDLHDLDLAGAYALLDGRLEAAIDRGARLVLLITGRPPKGEAPYVRGRIRAAVGDWLHASRHASAIAAVRNAHPRHGGAGALYIVLRKRR